MKTLFLVLAGVCLLAAPGLAQDDYPRAELFGGYSYLHTDTYMGNVPKGWAASVAGNLRRNFGVEANFSGHYESQFGSRFEDNHLFLFGPKAAMRLQKLTPWAHALVGTSLIRAHTQSNTLLGRVNSRDSATNFAWAIGGGLDVNVRKNVAIRMVQADYIRTASVHFFGGGLGGTYIQIYPHDSDNLRLSFGIVLRMGGH